MSVAQYCEEFGRRFQERRLALGKTLREFCAENGLEHGNLSRIERGRARPPTGTTLSKYLTALGLGRGSTEWKEFENVASACAGEVPPDLMSDAEIVKVLPVVFRTLGKRRPTEADLKSLIDTIRKT